MKKIIKSFVFIPLIVLSACESSEQQDNVQQKTAKTAIQKSLIENGISFTTATYFTSLSGVSSRSATSASEIYGIIIPTNIGADCTNNILVFDSWDTFNNTIEDLDHQIESEADAFDATVPPGTTDD